MTRALVMVVAALLTAFLAVAGAMAQVKTDPAQPRMEQKVEGTIKSVYGNLVMLEDGTELSIPSSVKVTKDQLKPGAQISAEYEQRGGHKIARSIQIKG